MNESNNEEADTQMVEPVMDSFEKRLNSVLVQTVDTDVIVILIGQFHDIKSMYPSVDI